MRKFLFFVTLFLIPSITCFALSEAPHQDLGKPESAVKIFFQALTDGSPRLASNMMHSEVSAPEEKNFKDKKVPVEEMKKFAAKMGKIDGNAQIEEVSAEKIKIKPERAGWIRVKFKTRKADGTAASFRAYVKKDKDGLYRIVNL